MACPECGRAETKGRLLYLRDQDPITRGDLVATVLTYPFLALPAALAGLCCVCLINAVTGPGVLRWSWVLIPCGAMALANLYIGRGVVSRVVARRRSVVPSAATRTGPDYRIGLALWVLVATVLSALYAALFPVCVFGVARLITI